MPSPTTLFACRVLFQSYLWVCASAAEDFGIRRQVPSESGAGDLTRGIGVAPGGKILSSAVRRQVYSASYAGDFARDGKIISSTSDARGTSTDQGLDFGVRPEVRKRDLGATRSVDDTATSFTESGTPNHNACSASLLREKKASLLLLGSSVDRKSLVNYCNHTGGDLRADEKFTKVIFSQNEPRICAAPSMDIGYLFIPGSGPPPYWGCDRYPHLTCGNHTADGHVQHAKTEDIISLDAPDFATRHFGSDPSLIVVESSLWDLARWWKKDESNWQLFNGKLDSYITQWCSQDIPNLLEQVQHAFPNSCVAFRTPPTVVGKSIGGSPEAIESMAECIRLRLKGNYLLIDYHQMVDDLVREGTPIKTLLPDGRHPNVDASVRYLDVATGLAAGKISADEVGSHWSNPATQKPELVNIQDSQSQYDIAQDLIEP